MTTHKVQVSFYVITKRFIEVDVPDTLEGDDEPDDRLADHGYINCDVTVEDHITGRVYNTLPHILDIRKSMEEEARTVDGWVDWDDRNGITVTTNTTVLP